MKWGLILLVSGVPSKSVSLLSLPLFVPALLTTVSLSKLTSNEEMLK